jgi:transcriptional regulator with XRE-family HTH domain
MDDNESLVETPGKRIQRLRERAGLSRVELAAIIGVGDAAIKKAENATGLKNFPQFDNALKMAVVLGVSPWDLAFGVNAELERAKMMRIAQIVEGEAGSPWASQEALESVHRLISNMARNVGAAIKMSPCDRGSSAGGRGR